MSALQPTAVEEPAGADPDVRHQRAGVSPTLERHQWRGSETRLSCDSRRRATPKTKPFALKANSEAAAYTGYTAYDDVYIIAEDPARRRALRQCRSRTALPLAASSTAMKLRSFMAVAMRNRMPAPFRRAQLIRRDDALIRHRTLAGAIARPGRGRRAAGRGPSWRRAGGFIAAACACAGVRYFSMIAGSSVAIAVSGIRVQISSLPNSDMPRKPRMVSVCPSATDRHLGLVDIAVARIEHVAALIVQSVTLHVADEGNAEQRHVLAIVGAFRADRIGRIAGHAETSLRSRLRRCRRGRRTETMPTVLPSSIFCHSPAAVGSAACADG